MTRAEVWVLALLTSLSAGSGVALGVMKYAMTPADPFAVVGHPWQPWALALHVVSSPLLAVDLGWLLAVHVRPRLRMRVPEGRRTGLASVGSALPMVASGAFIQTSTSPAWITGAVVVHIVSSALFTAGLAAHVVFTWQRARALAVQRSLARQETA